MTILSYKIECEPAPHSVNIDNWRMIQSCLYYYGNGSSTPGTRIFLADVMIEVMGYTPEMIHKAIFHDEIITNVIFSPNRSLNPGWCPECQGRGKTDWISKAMKTTGSRRYSDKYARSFKRNRERVLFYNSKKNGMIDWSIVFAPALIENNRAEYRCKECSGTGIRLDGRLTLFDGMVEMKHRMKEFEWDGLHASAK